MELISYLGVVRRKWWLILGIPFILGALVYVSSRSGEEVYEASATLLVNNRELTTANTAGGAPDVTDPDNTQQTQPQGPVSLNELVPNEGIMETFTQLISRRVVLLEVIENLVLPYSEAELRQSITAERVPGTQLIRVSVQDANPSLAAAIANETASVFIRVSTEETGQSGLAIADSAEEPLEPLSSSLLQSMILVVVAGFFLSSALALLTDYLDDKVRTPSDVEVISGFRTLAVIDRFRSQRGHPRDLSTAEDYRELRTNLRAHCEENDLRTILVASPGRGEGRSRTVLNLGYMLAEAGESVILVDADLRQPSLHKMIDTDNDRGLSNVLAESGRLDSLALKPVESRLDVLTAGPVPENPSIVSFPRMWDLLTELRSRADYIILDSPSVLAVVDAGDLARFVDGIILLVESGRTSAESLRAAVATLERSHAKIIGVVLNKGHSLRRAQRTYRAKPTIRQAPEEVVAEFPQPEIPAIDELTTARRRSASRPRAKEQQSALDGQGT